MTRAASEAREALRRLLERQSAALRAVLGSLDAERDALLARDAAALQQATGRKQDGLARVQELEGERRRLAPDLATMEAFAQSPQIAARWEEFLDLTRRCREQNEANGRAIRRQQRRVASVLELLRGLPAEAPSYGPDGEQRAAGNRAPIASA